MCSFYHVFFSQYHDSQKKIISICTDLCLVVCAILVDYHEDANHETEETLVTTDTTLIKSNIALGGNFILFLIFFWFID